MRNIFTVDVEDWHNHIAFSKQFAGVDTTGTARKGLEFILDLLKEHGHSGTFFFLGKMAEEQPELLRLVHEAGHEVASHGYSHTPLDRLTPEEFEKELELTERAIEKAIGVRPFGFRAPRYSLNEKTAWAVPILLRRKYWYDSSVFPARIPFFGYGTSRFPLTPYHVTEKGLFGESKKGLMEFPLLAFPLAGKSLPAKFRHQGTMVTKGALRRLNRAGHPGVFLIHTWELVRRPKVSSAGNPVKDAIRMFRIPATSQLRSLLSDHRFSFTSFQKFMEGDA